MAKIKNSIHSGKTFQKEKPGKGIDNRPKPSALPGGRKSTTGDKSKINPLFQNNLERYMYISMSEIRKIIPVIRTLMIRNTDVGQAIQNIVTLGNTGHKILFDKKVSAEQQDAMRTHLGIKRTEWASGQAGMEGVINRWFTQIMVSGALSNEWVPNDNLTGIESVILVNPEEVECRINSRGTKYDFYQRDPDKIGISSTITNGDEGLIKLNPNTYRYFALNGDGEIPYGFPPYLSVLPRIRTQKKMDDNIDFVVDQMGLMGFLEALIAKPDQLENEDDKKYESRLDRLLDLAKQRVQAGFKDGVVVGIKDDHEFTFNSPHRSYESAIELYKNNELMIASSLKQDSSLWGRAYSSSETQITVIFLKMISELKNTQNLIKKNLEFGYSLELKLAGYQFDNLKIVFNKSTIHDELKEQQAEEIKIRNVKDKLVLGIINIDTAADELGYETPDQEEPRVSWEIIAGGSAPKEGGLETDKTKKRADTKKKKTEGDTKRRRENKTIPKNK